MFFEHLVFYGPDHLLRVIESENFLVHFSHSWSLLNFVFFQKETAGNILIYEVLYVCSTSKKGLLYLFKNSFAREILKEERNKYLNKAQQPTENAACNAHLV